MPTARPFDDFQKLPAEYLREAERLQPSIAAGITKDTVAPDSKIAYALALIVSSG
ncbi:hypothetical protein [Mycobacterium paraense]|uniref:hypothetical protein n=1 Tax=Mycobacterium paraense TaxID=767916 RepID=UPI001481F834|nr:hypothetical protein [Mycobacterium paraense]